MDRNVVHAVQEVRRHQNAKRFAGILRRIFPGCSRFNWTKAFGEWFLQCQATKFDISEGVTLSFVEIIHSLTCYYLRSVVLTTLSQTYYWWETQLTQWSRFMAKEWMPASKIALFWVNWWTNIQIIFKLRSASSAKPDGKTLTLYAIWRCTTILR